MLSGCACGRASRGALSRWRSRSRGQARALGPRRRGGGSECAGGCGAALRAAATGYGAMRSMLTCFQVQSSPGMRGQIVACMRNDASLPFPGGYGQPRICS